MVAWDEHGREHAPTRDTAARRSRPIAADDVQSQRRQLAEGLLRLGTDAPTAVSADAIPEVRVPGSQVGMRLSQLLTALSARLAVWGNDALRATAEEWGRGGMPPPPDAYFYSDLHLMNIISHALEERVIAEGLDAEVYAGFQRLALLKPQVGRYRDLTRRARFVYLYGIDDERSTRGFTAPNLLRFPIDRRLGTGIEAYWFVVVEHPRLRCALLAQHLDGDLWSSSQRLRTYAGVWAFDARLVGEMVALLRQGARTLYYAQRLG